MPNHNHSFLAKVYRSTQKKIKDPATLAIAADNMESIRPENRYIIKPKIGVESCQRNI